MHSLAAHRVLKGTCRMKLTLCMALAIGLLGTHLGQGLSLCWAADEAVHVGKGVAQLFVDDFLIESQTDLKRTLHRPVKDEGGRVPVIEAAKGTSLQAYGGILYDVRLQKYVMFIREFFTFDVYLCTSSDGLTWDQNETRKMVPVEFDADLEADPGFDERQGFGMFTCYYDTDNAEYPYQGWLFYANYGLDREGLYYVRSRDGRAWERGLQVANAFAGEGDTSCRTIVQDGKTVHGPGDVSRFYHDERENRYLAILKFFRSVGGDRRANGYRSRAYLFVDRLDAPIELNSIKRIALLPAGAQRDGDTPFDEYYGSTAWRYGSLWLGGLKVHHACGDYPYSAAGCSFLKLAVSRDGLNWKKVPFVNDDGVPEVFIPNGPEGGNAGRNDGGYMCEFSQGPLRIGDELIYYYSASSYGKNHPRGTRVTGGGIFRARLRVDGFVSVDWGALTTRPLVLEGNTLFVNSIGPVTVEVLGEAGSVIGTAEVVGDAIRHRVDFDGQTLRHIAGTNPIRLRFIVPPEGRLYSFAVR